MTPHTPDFSREAPLGYAYCAGCGKLITQYDLVRETCPGRAA